ncbi:zinc ribbon domain-containing protein [Dehalobacter sp. DCM]|uniref:zinc ribbon domain-containing protein n=1 Tax=Dehalobacter sp. DCM TaxID=2907827 RepID=UPI0030817C4E|nr:zinc ribbon domain-containing protein [Dehalobacter sp. DCM]
MANDLFGGLSGLMKGLSGLMPQENLDLKLFNAQNELADLKRQVEEIYAEIGKQAYERNPNEWPQSDKLKLLQSNIAAAEVTRDSLGAEKQKEEAAKAAEEAKSHCGSCGYQNPEGTKFCQECGAALGAPAKTFCTSCGTELAPGTRFCGECGARQE